jgi:hypothetical protein
MKKKREQFRRKLRRSMDKKWKELLRPSKLINLIEIAEVRAKEVIKVLAVVKEEVKGEIKSEIKAEIKAIVKEEIKEEGKEESDILSHYSLSIFSLLSIYLCCILFLITFFILGFTLYL